MRTFRVSDPFPRGKPPQKLEWGSSAWAADSCLVEWSQLERDWLEPTPPQAQRPGREVSWEMPLAVWLALLVFGLVLTWTIAG